MFDPRLLARLQQKKDQLHALHPLPVAAVCRLNEQLTVEWIYNSNAIHGNTLTLRETQLILETGVAIGGRTLREHLEVINHREAIEYVERLVANDDAITPFHVRQLHKLVITRLDGDEADQYRTLPVTIAGATRQPPDAWRVPGLMSDWADWLKGIASELHCVARAALAHQRLIAIHPFLNGNGQTARLVMNLLLMRDGYPPTVIPRANHGQYHRALAQAEDGDERSLVNFVGRAVERSLTRYLEACTPRITPPTPDEEWIPLRKAARGTPYSHDYLGLLARKGRLEAIKRGRIWYTTRQAVTTYQESVAGPGDEDAATPPAQYGWEKVSEASPAG